MASLRTSLAVLLTCAAFAQGQRFQSAPSVVEPDYDYDAPPVAPQRPTQSQLVSRASGPAPSFRNSILSESTPVKTTTPVVAILKQINRHNEDGSYTYGYEGGDGSFKIETKLATGEVMGKYGYVDDSGKVRVIEYGANKYGFQPSGEGITVPEPNLVEEEEEVTESIKKADRIDEQLFQQPRPRQPARAPARAPAPVARPPPSRQQFAADSFQSRNNFEQTNQFEDPQLNTAPVQFLPEEQAPPRSVPSSFSVPSFSAFLTNDSPTPPRSAFAGPPSRPSFSDAPAPPRPSSFAGASPVPTRVQSFADSPVPPRPAAFAGAAPVPERPSSFAGAAPASPSFQSQPQPQFRPRPAQSFFQPAPAFSQPQQQRPANSRQSSSSILDQLEVDYALPQGSRPLHDITFGAQQVF